MSGSMFEFLRVDFPELYRHAYHAERTVEADPQLALTHMQPMGQWFIQQIAAHEEVDGGETDTLNRLERLLLHELIPAHLGTALKRLELLDPRESELVIDALQVKALWFALYDLAGWYYKTYVNSDYVAMPMHLAASASGSAIAVRAGSGSGQQAKFEVGIEGNQVPAEFVEQVENAYRFAGSEGETYEGQFANGLKHGIGLYRWADGTKYTGTWVRDQEHGTGEKLFANGDRYRGEWREGLFHGHGVYEWRDGSRFEGAWESGMEHGYGVKTSADGTVQRGYWTYGEFRFHEEQLGEGEPASIKNGEL